MNVQQNGEMVVDGVDTRAQLRPYLHKRVTVSAYFSRHDRVRTKHVTLVQSPEVAGGDVLLSHTWVQHTDAWEGLGLRKGDRLRFTAVVYTYPKDTEGGQVTCYGLRYPQDVQVVERVGGFPLQEAAPAAQPEPEPDPDPVPPAPPTSKVATVTAIHCLTTKHGWEAVEEVLGVVEKAGVEPVRQAIAFLKA